MAFPHLEAVQAEWNGDEVTEMKGKSFSCLMLGISGVKVFFWGSLHEVWDFLGGGNSNVF